MTSIAKPLLVPFRSFHLSIPFGVARRRRQATLDLIHSSPHLLRDIGMLESNRGERRP